MFEGIYKGDKPDLHGSYSTTSIYAFGEHHYIKWVKSTGENHILYGYGGDYEKAKFDNGSTKDAVKKRAKMNKRKLECIKSKVTPARTWCKTLH